MDAVCVLMCKALQTSVALYLASYYTVRKPLQILTFYNRKPLILQMLLQEWGACPKHLGCPYIFAEARLQPVQIHNMVQCFQFKTTVIIVLHNHTFCQTEVIWKGEAVTKISKIEGFLTLHYLQNIIHTISQFIFSTPVGTPSNYIVTENNGFFHHSVINEYLCFL